MFSILTDGIKHTSNNSLNTAVPERKQIKRILFSDINAMRSFDWAPVYLKEQSLLRDLTVEPV